MILGQLRIWVRQAKNAPLLDDEEYDIDAEDKAALNDIFVRYLKAILVA